MRSAPRQHVALVAAGVGASALAILLSDDGPAEFVFAVALVVPLLYALRHMLAAGVEAHREHRSARLLMHTDTEQVAREAVAAERARLALDVQSAVRADVERMRVLAQDAARTWAGDPRPALAAVQEQGRRAMTDLRRLLGLLRDNPGPSAEEDVPAVAAPRVLRIDVVLALLAVTDALLASLVYRRWSELEPLSAVGVVVTCLVAVTVVLRTLAPGPGAVIAGAVTLSGAAAGHPIGGGLWVIVTVGGLAWACAAKERHAAWAALGPAALAGAVTYSHQRYEPDNLAITLVIFAVGLISGLFVRLVRMRERRARVAAAKRRTQIDELTHEALTSERRTVARELHDAVSGSVGVVVMQAAAAEALLPNDPARARHALDVVLDTCESALAELGNLLGELAAPGIGSGVAERNLDDVRDLAERMRAAGLDLRLVLDVPTGAPDPAALAVTYRVLQESLTNVLRHAPGARVRVAVQYTGASFLIHVEDDGPGPTGHELRGFGLVGLGERVQQLGGTLTAAAGPSGGFLVRAEVPVRPRHADALSRPPGLTATSAGTQEPDL